MASHRDIPKRLTRFNYWTRAGTRPASALELSFGRSASKDRHEQFADRFQKHRNGPCGVPGCGTDKLYQNATPKDRERLALEELAATDSRWNNVRGAQALYRKLDTEARKRIDSAWSLRSGQWRTLLRNIARDQLAYDQITRSKPRDEELFLVAERFGRSESWARQVYARYSAQASDLRGAGVLVPSPEGRRAWQQAGLTVEGRRVKTVSQIPQELTKGKTGRARRASEDRWIEHWFAHALRNLGRYRNNNEPMPWPGRDAPPGASQKCVETCLDERNRRAEDV